MKENVLAKLSKSSVNLPQFDLSHFWENLPTIPNRLHNWLVIDKNQVKKIVVLQCIESGASKSTAAQVSTVAFLSRYFTVQWRQVKICNGTLQWNGYCWTIASSKCSAHSNTQQAILKKCTYIYQLCIQGQGRWSGSTPLETRSHQKIWTTLCYINGHTYTAWIIHQYCHSTFHNTEYNCTAHWVSNRQPLFGQHSPDVTIPVRWDRHVCESGLKQFCRHSSF